MEPGAVAGPATLKVSSSLGSGQVEIAWPAVVVPEPETPVETSISTEPLA